MAKVIEWNLAKGDALQGDVILFRVPEGFKFGRSNEVQRKDFGLVLAEGEVTGHHHAIWNRNPPTPRRSGSTVASTPGRTRRTSCCAPHTRSPRPCRTRRAWRSV